MLPADTARLVFRSWTAGDEALAVALWGDPRVTALLDARAQLDLEAVRDRLAHEIRVEKEHGFQYWLLFDASGAHVGCCGLKPKEPGVLELGFHLRPEHWGHGYAFEAARAVVAHAFVRLGTGAIYAGHHPQNEASRRTLTRLGFRYVGDELFPPTGAMHPGYVLDKQAWR